MNRVRLRSFSVIVGVGLFVGIVGLIVPRISTRPTPGGREMGILQNLRALVLVKNAWAADTRSGPEAIPTESDLAPYFNGGKFPEPLWHECYQIRAIGELPTATLGKRRFEMSPESKPSLGR